MSELLTLFLSCCACDVTSHYGGPPRGSDVRFEASREFRRASEPRHQPLLGRIFAFLLILQQDFGPRSGRCVAGRDYRITNQNQVVARIAAMRSAMQDVSNLNV